MKEQIISFETAKLAKEKGFYLEGGSIRTEIGYFVRVKYSESEEEYEQNLKATYEERSDLAIVCTQSLLQKWLRDMHEIDVEVSIHNNLKYWADVNTRDEEGVKTTTISDEHGHTLYFETYEEALEEGLKAALKLIP